jgi:phage baseplate assembly protein W
MSIDINNFGRAVKDIEDIKQSWYIILNTVKGSAPLRPEFGSEIFEYIDKPINSLGGDFVAIVISDLEKWEKRATIQQVEKILTNGRINVKVFGMFTAQNTPISATIDLTLFR